jgi:ABC-type transporter Mla maintaining outer membrane lipid asymmetry ATPase subunit MlaF
MRNGGSSPGYHSAAASGEDAYEVEDGLAYHDDDADTLIEFRNVHKSFGDKPILNGASFRIRRGEAVGIIGASGTGKSTTLRLAAGLLAPDRGSIYFKGKKRVGLLSDQDESSLDLRVGMVFQNAALFDSLTVGENVGFMLYEHSSLPASEIRRRVAGSLAKVGLKGVEKLYPSELSGGMKKRVALARAVVPDVRSSEVEQVLMYDEPTAGLDPVASTVVEDLIRSLQRPHQLQQQLQQPMAYGAVAAAGVAAGAAVAIGPEGMEMGISPAASPLGSMASDGEGGDGSGSDGEGGGGGERGGSGVGGISSYIVVTHQHSTIRRAVDRLIFLHEGRVVWEGSTAEFDVSTVPIVQQFREGTLAGPIAYL